MEFLFLMILFPKFLKKTDKFRASRNYFRRYLNHLRLGFYFIRTKIIYMTARTGKDYYNFDRNSAFESEGLS